MSLVWAADWRGEDEPRDVHPLTCKVWTSNDPCNCPTEPAFEAGVQEKLDRFESYAGRSS